MFQQLELEQSSPFEPTLASLNTEQEIMWGVWADSGAQEETCSLAAVSGYIHIFISSSALASHSESSLSYQMYHAA